MHAPTPHNVRTRATRHTPFSATRPIRGPGYAGQARVGGARSLGTQAREARAAACATYQEAQGHGAAERDDDTLGTF